MRTFAYKATTHSGELEKSYMEANTADEVISRLREKHLIPLSVKEKRAQGDLFENVDLKLPFRRFSQKGLLILTQELSTLLNAGLPLDRSLQIVIDISDSEKVKKAVRDLLKVIERGESFSDALSQSNTKFPELYINMIKAGEEGGVLPQVLERLSEYIESSMELKSDVINTLIYPVILTLVGGCSLLFIMVYVIPKFSVIFADMGASIPASASFIIEAGRFLQNYWWALLGIAVFVFAIFKFFLTMPQVRMAWDKFKLSVPLFGTIISKLEVGRFARTLGTLIKSGVPILSSLRIVKNTIQNHVIAHSVGNVAERLRKGEGISSPLKNAGIFPPLFEISYFYYMLFRCV